MLSKYQTLLLDNLLYEEFDSYREEYLCLQEIKKEKITKKIDNGVNAFVKAVKELYTTDEQHLIDHTMEFSKLITRAAIAGSIFYINPLMGLISAYTGYAIRKMNDAKKREKLMRLYKSKLEYIEGKIEKEEDDKKKYALIKLRNKLQSDLNKISVVK